MTIVYAILILCLIIIFHEVGHFTAAKLCNIRVNEFSIGMGPKLLQFGKKETRYSIRALPIGGYVRMEGEEEHSDDERSFSKKPVWQRAIVVVAGAFMNLVLGYLICVVMSAVWGNSTGTVIQSVAENSPAQVAGFQAGDEVIRINGVRTHIRSDINYEMSKNQGNRALLTIKRGDQVLETEVLPVLQEGVIEETGEAFRRYMIGVTFVAERSIPDILYHSFFEMIFIVKVVVESLAMLATGKVAVSEVSGPVGIVTAVGTAAKTGWFSLLSLTALLTINLGVFNLLPIPALDGGKELFLLIEAIRRKPIRPEREGMISFIGFALLILLVLVATFNDIARLFHG